MSTRAESSQPFDLARIERLVGQLEARSTALVAYRSAERPQPSLRASNIAAVSALVAVWLGALVLVIAYFLMPPQLANKNRVANQRVISTLPNRKTQKTAIPGHPLAKVPASSSHRLQPLEATVANAEMPHAETPSITAFQPCDKALPRQAADGTDYWVTPGGPHHNSPTNIIYIGKSIKGVVVRSLADDRYYTVTPACGWRSIPIPRSANER